MASPTKGSAPWTPVTRERASHDGVPPLSLARRGGSLLYFSRETVGPVHRLAADAKLGTN